MSHHYQIYRVFPTDEASQEDWVRADRWLNGMKFFFDANEAEAFAKLGVVNCRVPFEIDCVPCGGVKEQLVEFWTIAKVGKTRVKA